MCRRADGKRTSSPSAQRSIRSRYSRCRSSRSPPLFPASFCRRKDISGRMRSKTCNNRYFLWISARTRSGAATTGSREATSRVSPPFVSPARPRCSFAFPTRCRSIFGTMPARSIPRTAGKTYPRVIFLRLRTASISRRKTCSRPRSPRADRCHPPIPSPFKTSARPRSQSGRRRD